MDDVVDLTVLLGGAGLDVGVGGHVWVEPGEVRFVGVEFGGAVDHPLGEGLAYAARVGYPDGLGKPETLDVGGFAQEGHAVSGE